MRSVAQTYPQLARQLATVGWSGSDLRRVRSAFDLASSLFIGAERGSAKPFIDHLVGTASCTIIGGGGPGAVAAALLHAAYDQGDFGTGRNGATDRHRRRLIAAVGADVEDLVLRYHHLAWTPTAARSVLERLPGLDDVERTVLLVRVANEVDDGLDGGLVLSGKGALGAYSPEARQIVVDIADVVASDDLCDLARGVLLGEPLTFPPELIVGKVGSAARVPERAVLRPGLRMRALGRRLAQKLRRLAR